MVVPWVCVARKGVGCEGGAVGDGVEPGEEVVAVGGGGGEGLDWFEAVGLEVALREDHRDREKGGEEEGDEEGEVGLCGRGKHRDGTLMLLIRVGEFGRCC